MGCCVWRQSIHSAPRGARYRRRRCDETGKWLCIFRVLELAARIVKTASDLDRSQKPLTTPWLGEIGIVSIALEPVQVKENLKFKQGLKFLSEMSKVQISTLKHAVVRLGPTLLGMFMLSLAELNIWKASSLKN
ncbi:hypothetical protein EVAR_68784_1 [Eumeta japonica]|uniref:Uncharacterized protein n=1 Tax=Eumeta variegata TaxID=151549 RepID=A0A4C1Z9T5_EUMVA|nr:hypothetical protein EVAR_68784_1 [Eumeta japonica]